jgi:hypothetical protein
MNFVYGFVIRAGDNSADYPVDYEATLHRFRYDFDIDAVRCDEVFRAWLDQVMARETYHEADLEGDLEWLEKLGTAKFYVPILASMGMPNAPTFVAQFGAAFVAHIGENNPAEDAAVVANLLRDVHGGVAFEYVDMAGMVEYEDVGQFFEAMIHVLVANGYPAPDYDAM